MISWKIGPAQGVQLVIGKLTRLPGATAIAVITFARHMLPFLRNAYPSQKRISRAQAYPQSMTVEYGPHKGRVVQGYFSTRQYYYVILNIKGPYARTNQTKENWSASQAGPTLAYIRNTHPPSKYSMGNEQANLNKLVGWQKAITIIRANMAGGISAVRKAILAWLGF